VSGNKQSLCIIEVNGKHKNKNPAGFTVCE
jgi:hypothetical protein